VKWVNQKKGISSGELLSINSRFCGGYSELPYTYNDKIFLFIHFIRHILKSVGWKKRYVESKIILSKFNNIYYASDYEIFIMIILN
jgi:hypothetical protein